MNSRLPFIKQRLALNLAGAQSVASDLLVCWTETTGGTLDAGTGGVIGGDVVHLSGTTRAFGHESEPKSVLRRFTEIEAGDLILDLAPNPLVAVFPGQGLLSGTVALDALADKGLRYVWNGRYYVAKEVSPELQMAWDAYVGNVQLHRTLVLRRET